MFAGRQAQPTGELPRAPKRVDMSDAADERGGRHQPDAGNREEARHDGVGVGEGAQLALERRQTPLNRAHVLVHAGQHRPQVQRQGGLGVFENRRHRRQRAAGAGGQ